MFDHRRLNLSKLLPIISLLVMVPGAVRGDKPLRDPTRPAFATAVVKVPGAQFSVSAIFIADMRRVAVVNGQLVGEGDEVAGARVEHIEPGLLTLRYRGKLLTARLKTAKVRE